MRVLVLVLAFLAVPALAAAQQAIDAPAEDLVPRVELQQSATPAPATADVAEMEGTGLQPVTVEARSQKVDAAAQAGDPTQARWWWLVAAIVVGAIIATVVL
jgi:hypothetical protein